MTPIGAGGVVRLIQTLWDGGTVASLDDAELLGRFLRRDGLAEAAFAALVQRHSAMVLRVCRDVTGNCQDAEDAAQVTFLVLARRARSIRRGEALANWLFGTARRVAARLVRDATRRRRREQQYAEMSRLRGESDETRDDREPARAGLYSELERLPPRYRVPIILCDLEDLTHDQAALAIGCPLRTLQTRLYRGRDRLRQQLARRGLLPAVGLVGRSPVAEAGRATMSTSWASATTAAAMNLARGRVVATPVPEAVNQLLQGVNRAMFLSRLKWTATVIVILGLSAGLTLGLVPIAPGAGRPKTAASVAAPRQDSARPEKEKARPEPKSVAKEGKAGPPAPITTPITVRGRATDSADQPVAEATIYLVSTNGQDALLGTTTTERDGSYIFRNARLPVSRSGDDAPLAGRFQVYGTAPGRGFAWHGMRFYQPRRRPDGLKVAGEDYTVFGIDPKVMDLRFPPAATLKGRIVDGAGRPVAGVRIRIGSCDYLDTKGKESHHNFREFWAIGSAPAGLTTTKTDPDGRFRLDGLPKEAGFRIFVEHPAYTWMDVYAATTDRPTTAFDYPLQSIFRGPERPPVATRELNLTLRATRRIAVRTIFADSGRPAPKVKVSAGVVTAGPSAYGITDAEGRLQLRLPPGEYEVVADPTEGGAACVRTCSSLIVHEQPAEQALEVRVTPGCVLVLEVVDAKTRQGIPGVQFLYEPDGQPGSRHSVQSRSGYIDNPRSDADGRLRAVVEPGERVYSVGYIPESAGYRQQQPEKRVVLPAGGSVTVQFELRK
jgi:RNA polymerase sigma factor (sigma-70 family)